jgi:L-malate glycosyltransferase
MKVALLAAGNSIHTIRWANGLVDAGVDVHLITQHPCSETVDERVAVTEFQCGEAAGYFRIVPPVRRLLRAIEADVLNAHYASGYATTARLAGFHPWLLSVWGSDVYEFPFRSPLHRWWVRKNLLAADRVASTSRNMAAQIRTVAPVPDEILVTPFGVDFDTFSSAAGARSRLLDDSEIVIGTVKALAHQYGVDTLIRAFTSLRSQLAHDAPDVAARLRLRIVGDGPDREALTALASDLGVRACTEFPGRVPHEQVPRELAALDIFAALSRRESFGVAIIEAGAAHLPVVVSDVGGLPEVVRAGETGIIVPRDDPDAAAKALRMLVLDRATRVRMGEAGAAHVAREYSWSRSVAAMLHALELTLEHSPGRKAGNQ